MTYMDQHICMFVKYIRLVLCEWKDSISEDNIMGSPPLADFLLDNFFV